MSGVLAFSKANPLRMVITSWVNRNANDSDYQFFRTFSQPFHDSFFTPFQQNDSLYIQFDSSFDTTNVVTLRNYYTDSVVETPSVTEVADRTTYKTYESTFNTASLNGLYYVQVVGTDTDTETYTAKSEPFEFRSTQCNTSLIQYYNNEVAFGIDWRSEVTFEIRIPAWFDRLANTEESETSVNSGGNKTMISSEITRARTLKASKLIPQWLIEKVNIALSCDYCAINGVQVVTDSFWPYELLSDKRLWAEPTANIGLYSGVSSYYNSHDSATRETL